jgi:hypothetical protein
MSAPPARRLFIIDCISKQWSLVDTGSDLCIFPCKPLPGYWERTDYTLYAANATTIPTYGWTSRSLNLGLRHFTWRVVVAEVLLPIIGVDLLSHYVLLVDCRNNHLLDRVTSLSIPRRTTIRPQCKSITGGTHTEPPGEIPGADETYREPSRGAAQHHITPTQHPAHQ